MNNKSFEDSVNTEKSHSEHYQPTRFVTVDIHHDGQRIDNFLLREIKNAPRSYIYRILRKGEVRVNKKRAKPLLKIRKGDVVRIPPIFLKSRAEANTAPKSLLDGINKSIISEDDDIIFVNKSSGLAVHGGTGQKYGLIESFRQLRPDLDFIELVHRLDKETSGIVMLAKNRNVLLELHDMLKDKQINKHYQTLALGKWRDGRQHIKSTLRRQQGKKSKVKVVDEKESGKLSESIFYPMHTYKTSNEFYTLLEVELLTGRMHQIRTQLMDRGYPILGDSQYGDFTQNRTFKKKTGLKRLFLHAFHVHFNLNSSSTNYDIKIPLPDDLKNVLGKLENE